MPTDSTPDRPTHQEVSVCQRAAWDRLWAILLSESRESGNTPSEDLSVVEAATVESVAEALDGKPSRKEGVA